MLPRWAPIVYRGFHDIPRIFIVRDDDQTYLFACVFDETLDDYPDDFSVYRMPALEPTAFDGSWENLSEQAIGFLGKVNVSSVSFDETLRKAIDLNVLAQIA